MEHSPFVVSAQRAVNDHVDLMVTFTPRVYEDEVSCVDGVHATMWIGSSEGSGLLNTHHVDDHTAVAELWESLLYGSLIDDLMRCAESCGVEVSDLDVEFALRVILNEFRRLIDGP